MIYMVVNFLFLVLFSSLILGLDLRIAQSQKCTVNVDKKAPRVPRLRIRKEDLWDGKC